MFECYASFQQDRQVRIWLLFLRRAAPLEFVMKNNRLGAIIRANMRNVPFIVMLGLAASFLEGSGIGLLIPLTAILLAGTVPDDLPAPITGISESFFAMDPGIRTMAMVGAVLALIVMKGLVQTASTIMISRIETGVARDLRDNLSSLVLRLDYPFFLKNDAARLAVIISGDSWAVSHAVRAALLIIPAAAGLSVFGFILAWLDWRLFLVALAGGMLILAVLTSLEGRQARLSAASTSHYHLLFERMLAIVTATRTIRIFGQQQREQARFAEASENVRAAMFSIHRLSAFVAPSLDMLVAILFVAILLAGYQIGVSVPEMIVFLVILLRSQSNVQMISKARMGIAEEKRAIAEVEWLLDQAELESRLSGPEPVASIDRPIIFDRVSYDYPDGSAALHDVSVSILPGVATALIGKSGAGKTTLVNLVCRLLVPQSGTIRMGGQPIDRMNLAEWRGRIAIAGQDFALADGNVADNIAYGCPGASPDDVRRAAQAAGADRFIDRLANGYETPVGREGTHLSGGQRQRIALARALIKEPDLLILDEATNAVDAMTETEIMTLLKEHRHFRTALVISHRQSTLSACQQGIVIDDGRIVEAGPLQELAYYQRMTGGHYE